MNSQIKSRMTQHARNFVEGRTVKNGGDKSIVQFNLKMKDDERAELREKSKAFGFSNDSEFIKYLITYAEVSVTIPM